MDNDTEILYASFDSDVEKTAFFVALDYLTKSIVITIRGTLSTQVSWIFITEKNWE